MNIYKVVLGGDEGHEVSDPGPFISNIKEVSDALRTSNPDEMDMYKDHMDYIKGRVKELKNVTVVANMLNFQKLAKTGYVALYTAPNEVDEEGEYIDATCVDGALFVAGPDKAKVLEIVNGIEQGFCDGIF
jgi:hypothetical protein